MDASLSELQEMVMDREAWRAVIYGVTKSQTEWLIWYWTDLIHSYSMELLLYLDLYQLNICTTWFGGYVFKDFIFYRVVLCSQQNGEEDTCIPHVLPAPEHA